MLLPTAYPVGGKLDLETSSNSGLFTFFRRHKMSIVSPFVKVALFDDLCLYLLYHVGFANWWFYSSLFPLLARILSYREELSSSTWLTWHRICTRKMPPLPRPRASFGPSIVQLRILNYWICLNHSGSSSHWCSGGLILADKSFFSWLLCPLDVTLLSLMLFDV